MTKEELRRMVAFERQLILSAVRERGRIYITTEQEACDLAMSLAITELLREREIRMTGDPVSSHDGVLGNHYERTSVLERLAQAAR